jgi:hypothetical protein
MPGLSSVLGSVVDSVRDERKMVLLAAASVGGASTVVAAVVSSVPLPVLGLFAVGTTGTAYYRLYHPTARPHDDDFANVLVRIFAIVSLGMVFTDDDLGYVDGLVTYLAVVFVVVLVARSAIVDARNVPSE